MKYLFCICLFFNAANCFCQDISGTYAIKNAETGIFIRIKDANSKNGTPIVAYSPVNWKCVTWDFKKQDEGYQLVNLFSKKTMQPPADAQEGTALVEQPLKAGEASQKYEFIPVKENSCLIRLSGTEFYLTPSDDKGDINNPIVLKRKLNTRLQYWTLQEQHPVM